MLNNTSIYLGVLLVLHACTGRQPDDSGGMADVTSPPQMIPVNTQEGYQINPITGDSIQPIINSFGDTLVTGVPVPAKGKAIHPDSLTKPVSIPSGEPKAIAAHRNIHEIPKTLAVIPVKKESLVTFAPGKDTSMYVLVNSTGDTVPTGVPLPIAGRVIPCLQPQSVQAWPAQKKDNATRNIKYLDVEQGMNSTYVLSCMEDRHGNLWFGTWGGGVSRYDGETFTHFTQKEGLSNNRIYAVLEDRHGNLWFGTYLGGVSRYDGESFTHFTEKEGMSSNTVRCITEDSQGNIWFGTGGGGVSKYDGETITHFSRKEGLSSNYIWSILEDSRGQLWFGTEGGGVDRYTGGMITHYTEKDGLSNNNVRSILEDSHGNLWFGTVGSGVCMFDGDSFTHFTESEGLSNNNITSILEDRKGHLWFTTDGGGVSRYDGKTFMHITENEGLSNNYTWSALEDSFGNLWFGTWAGGVDVYNEDSFVHFTQKEGLSNNIVWSILEDRQGRLWFSTEGGGVVMYNGRSFMHLTRKEGLTSSNIRSIMEDHQGNLWFGTGGSGASRYDGESLTHYTREEGLSSNNVRSMLADSRGNLWFGTGGGGVTRYDGETFMHFTEKEGMGNNIVRSILEDSQGNLWFGTRGGGACKYDGRTFTHFTEKEGLSGNTILSMLEDSHGNIWFGTGGRGVCKYDGRIFTIYTEDEGLSNNIVYSILEDADHNIWFSTEKGLNCLVRGQIMHTYGLQDGLKGLDFYINSVLLDSKNRIWWGSSKSLTMLDMNLFRIPDEPPSLILNSLEIDEKFVDYRHLEEDNYIKIEFSAVDQFHNYPINPILPYKNNYLTFHFSAVDWSAPHKIRYSYKMEGLDDNWSLPSPEAKAVYRSMPFGSYTFQVRARGGAQKWSESFSYYFTITPPWWHTWWARAGYVFTAMLLILGFVRLRTAHLKQRQKELKAEVNKATLQIRVQKEEVETQRDEIEAQKEEIESQRDEVVSVNQALENQKRELELTLENLKLLQSQLIQSEKMASVGVLTAGIAHELNNPINFVSGNVKPLLRDVNDVFKLVKKYDEIVKSKELRSEFGEVEQLKTDMDYSILMKEIIDLLEGIEEGANRSSQIVKGLRSFSRLDDEICQLYDIHDVIDSTLILLHNKLKNRITVRKDYGDFGAVECFPSKLNQVIMNILTNSIQAIDGEGEIFIQTVSSDIGIKIVIKDNGKGMTPEVKEHIFEPFFTTKEVGQGTGLGLSISYGIIEHHHGSIDVISEPGKGTEFIISLPKSQSIED